MTDEGDILEEKERVHAKLRLVQMKQSAKFTQ